MRPFALAFAILLLLAPIFFLAIKRIKKIKRTNPLKKKISSDNAESSTQIGCTFDE